MPSRLMVTPAIAMSSAPCAVLPWPPRRLRPKAPRPPTCWPYSISASRILPGPKHSFAAPWPTVPTGPGPTPRWEICSVATPWADYDEEPYPETTGQLAGLVELGLQYLDRVDSFTLPPEKRFRQIHDGHATYMIPEEKVFVTPEAIEAVCMVGSAEDIIDQVRTAADNGIKEINIMPAADHCREAYKDFAELIIPAFR